MTAHRLLLLSVVFGGVGAACSLFLSEDNLVGPGTDGGSEAGDTPDGARDAGFDEPPLPAANVCDAGANVLEEVSAVVAGNGISCAIQKERLLCWGALNGGGPRPRFMSGVTGAVRGVALGVFHGCAIVDEAGKTGLVKCFGLDPFGAGLFGDGSDGGSVSIETPVEVRLNATTLLNGVRELGAGGAHSCALLDTGKTFCWGSSGSQAVLPGSLLDRSFATEVPVPLASHLMVGVYHTCILEKDQATLDCWGNQGPGDAGALTVTSLPAEGVSVPPLGISGGASSTCVVGADHIVSCRGLNDNGQLGSTNANGFIPTLTPTLANAKQHSLALAHGCATRVDGTLVCLGNNAFGQLGFISAAIQVFEPTKVPIERVLEVSSRGAPVQALGFFGAHTCAMVESACGPDAGARLACWGNNQGGQLGNGLDGGIFPQPGFVLPPL